MSSKIVDSCYKNFEQINTIVNGNGFGPVADNFYYLVKFFVQFSYFIYKRAHERGTRIGTWLNFLNNFRIFFIIVLANG